MNAVITKTEAIELCESAVALRATMLRTTDEARRVVLCDRVNELIAIVGRQFNVNVSFKVVAEANKVIAGKNRSTIAWL